MLRAEVAGLANPLLLEAIPRAVAVGEEIEDSIVFLSSREVINSGGGVGELTSFLASRKPLVRYQTPLALDLSAVCLPWALVLQTFRQNLRFQWSSLKVRVRNRIGRNRIGRNRILGVRVMNLMQNTMTPWYWALLCRQLLMSCLLGIVLLQLLSYRRIFHR